MKVREIEPLQPLDSMYELRSDRKYIIFVPVTEVPRVAIEAALIWLKRERINAVIIQVCSTKDFRIFDMESLP